MSKPKKILIAEDDEFLNKIMTASLRGAGFEIDSTADGEEALARAIDDSYCIVLLDLIMPKRDGFEVLRELKKREIDTPILVFSNLSQDSDRELALSLGAKAYYVKSDIAINELVEAVKKHCK